MQQIANLYYLRVELVRLQHTPSPNSKGNALGREA